MARACERGTKRAKRGKRTKRMRRQRNASKGGLILHARRCGPSAHIACLQGLWLGLFLKQDRARSASTRRARQFRAFFRVLPRAPHEAQHELLGLPASEPHTGTSDRPASIPESQSPEEGKIDRCLATWRRRGTQP